jgi:hypothetical protein
MTESENELKNVEMKAYLTHVILNIRGKYNRPKSRELALAVTKLQEAIFWIEEAENQANLSTMD